MLIVFVLTWSSPGRAGPPAVIYCKWKQKQKRNPAAQERRALVLRENSGPRRPLGFDDEAAADTSAPIPSARLPALKTKAWLASDSRSAGFLSSKRQLQMANADTSVAAPACAVRRNVGWLVGRVVFTPNWNPNCSRMLTLAEKHTNHNNETLIWADV